MSVDVLQEKIRKLKSAVMVEFCPVEDDVPAHIMSEAGSLPAAFLRYGKELLAGLRETVPAVRISFSAFALLGAEGLNVLEELLQFARKQGYYVLLDGPEIFSVRTAQLAATLLAPDSRFPCDGLVVGSYLGSDGIKPFLPYCKEAKKDLFVVARTANKSAPEIQDLLSGGRVVHAAAADHVNRYGGDTAGKFGYTRVGILAAASSAPSLKDLRGKYPKLFMILDGADYPNANAKNCANGFDKFGHGAIAVVGSSVTAAWKAGESDGSDFVEQAIAAAQRMKKNLNRYITIL